MAVLKVSADLKAGRTKAVEIEVAHITVLMGANGSGKSRLLAAIGVGKRPGFNAEPILVSGRRVARLPAEARLPRRNIGRENVGKFIGKFKPQTNEPFITRVTQKLRYLRAKDMVARGVHLEALTHWSDAGELGPSPKRKPYLLEAVFSSFSEVFPAIRITLQGMAEREEGKRDLIVVEQGGHSYRPEAQSEGERQVLSLLVDLVFGVEHKKGLILVDEPELSLHPALANHLWDVVESALPTCSFIYATHSVSFAMRDKVERLYIMAEGQQPREVTELSECGSRVLEALMGNLALPGQLKAVVFCEGEMDSVDARMLNWLLRDDDVVVEPVGVRAEVGRALQRRKVLERAAPGLRVTGVVDRDNYSQGQVSSDRKMLIVTEFNEIESYFADPVVLQQVLPDSDAETTAQLVVEAARALRTTAVGKAMQAVPRGKKGGGNAQKLGDAFTCLVQDIEAILESSDIGEILARFPGKELLGEVCQQAGLDGPEWVIERVLQMPPPVGSQLMVLREAILARI
jgi:ABC-type lipoprotein export system ATPase subunit